MKIGIVTQPLYANYGGILQNYALQQILKDLGHHPVTIDYMPSLSFKRYLLYVGKCFLLFLSPTKRHPIKPYKHFLERPINIDAFVRNNISLTKTIPKYSKRLLRKNGIEAIIVGSDQVWRYSYNSHYLEDMYLAFAEGFNCVKIAFSASFGKEDWDYPADRAAVVRKLIKQFKTVSVRETSGIRLCKEYLATPAVFTLDPTLLLPASVYESLCKSQQSRTEPYLAACILDLDQEKKGFIEAFAASNGWIVKSMTVTDAGCPVEEWLTTIKDSEYVITDSYHGSLFSILFKKQFMTFVNEGRGADRFVSLFSHLGIEDRMLRSLSDNLSTKAPIDYDKVEPLLNSLRESSISFLIEALKRDEH